VAFRRKGPIPEGYKNDSRGLVRVPRSSNTAAFWFINLDANAMSLSDYLAGAKEYIDNIADQSEIGMTIVPGGQNFQVDANWKLWHENGMDPFPCPQRAFDLLSNMPPTPPRPAPTAPTRKACRPPSSTPRPAPKR
jgi:hypothetical protein